MSRIYPNICKADAIVLASPLYYSELTGAVLNFASRLQYFYASEFIRKDHSIHIKPKKAVLLLIGGGSSKDVSCASKTAGIILKQINALITVNISYLNTDKAPLISHPATLEKIYEAAEYLNQTYHALDK